MFASVKGTGIINSKLGCVRLGLQPHVNSDLIFDDACTLRMKGAKDSSIVMNFSRFTIKNVVVIDKVACDEEEEEQAILEFGNSSKCMYFYMSFGPL